MFESRRIFNIPKYQRAYAWEDRQLQDFIHDLENQLLERDYFFGTLLLQVKESEGYYKIIDLVDGQQRITTLTIFMHILLNSLATYGDEIGILKETYIKYRDEYKLRILEYDNEFFKTCILEDNPEASKLIETPYQRRLFNAKKFFTERLSQYSCAKLREFKEKIENAKVLTYAVVNNSEATLIFETTNDRGKPLTVLEKIKSFLMYKIYFVSNSPEEDLISIQNRFGEIYRDFEATQLNLTISEQQILQHHYIAFEASPDSQKNENYYDSLSLIKQKINLLSSDLNGFSQAGEYIDKYSRELQETFSGVRSMSKEIYGNLLNIFHLKRDAYFFPILIVAFKFDNTPSRDFFRRVTKLLEIVSFRVYGIRKRRQKNTTLRNSLYALAQKFEGDIEQLINGLKDIIGEFCSDREFRDKLSSSRFYEDVAAQNDLTYLFWQYENYIRRVESQEWIGYRRYRNLSIEHIIPQVPRQLKDWMDDEFFDNYLNSIGNLTLDTISENSSKSNLSFEQKYYYYYQHSPFLSQRELNKFINQETNDWDITSVKDRQQKVINFAMDYWDYRSV